MLAARDRWPLAVAALAAGMAAILVEIDRWRYAIFRNDVDLGIFTQVAGGLFTGFSSTVEGGVNHLLVHWSPIVALGYPFVRAFGPIGLEYLQCLLVSATLFPLWGLARARFRAPVAFAVVCVCALYPVLAANAVGDFHEMAFVPLLCATLVWALDRRRWRWGIAAAVLLACTKEDQFVSLAFAGAAIALLARGDAPQRRFGLAVAGIAVGMALVYFGIVRNVLSPHLAYGSLHFFAWNGTESAGGAAFDLLVRPRLWYVVVVLAPLAFLPCVSRYGLFLIPGFVEVLASHEPVTIAPGAHYVALLTGYALAAFVDGASVVARANVRAAAGAVTVAAALAVVIEIWASPMEYWYYTYRLPDAHDARLEQTLQTIPPYADVGAEDEIFAHLATNPHASITAAGQEWFVFDRTHFSHRWHDVDEPIVRRAIAARAYRVLYDDDGIVLLRENSAQR